MRIEQNDLNHHLTMIQSGARILDNLDENHPDYVWFNTAVSSYIQIIMYKVEEGEYPEKVLSTVSEWVGADIRVQTDEGVI